jgi:hypothetical protein
MTEFKKGQKVHFCHTKRTGRNINFTTKQGEILLVKDKTLSVVCRKKVFVVNKDEATLIGQRTALTNALMTQD